MARSYVGEARRRGLGRRRERIGPIVERLAAEHPDAEIALRFRSDLELLVSVMLSAQTTDTNVNRVTEQLFRKYRTPEDYLEVPQEELERDIYATGFFRQKARAIRGTMRVLSDEYGGKVPSRLEDLVKLPGVARKTANVVASELGHAQGIVVDTRAAPLTAPGAHPERRSRQDRARSPARRPTTGLGAFSAPAHLARSTSLRRSPAAVRELCRRGALSGVAGREPRTQIQWRQRNTASCAIVEATISPTDTPIDQ